MRLERIGFAYNPTKEAALDLRERAEGWCQLRGISHWAAPAGELKALVEHLPDTDALVVLGGDGTFLRAARAVAEVDVPLLGVNLGKIGFLSKVEAQDLEVVLARLVEGDFRLEDRMALQATIHPGGRDEAGETFFALNEIVVARGSMARVCRIEV
jgi:NAD+ kinase